MEPSLEMIESLARRAGVLLKEGFGKEHQVDFKHAKDLVTEMDRKAEDLILGEIREKFPAHSILSEESGSLAGERRSQVVRRSAGWNDQLRPQLPGLSASPSLTANWRV